MTWVYNENVECPVCGGYHAHTDVNIHTNEREWNCERCGFYSTTEIVERAGRKFWQHTMHMPMSADGKVAWPKMQPVESRHWNRKEFGVMPGFEAMTDGFGVKVAEEEEIIKPEEPKAKSISLARPGLFEEEL